MPTSENTRYQNRPIKRIVRSAIVLLTAGALPLVYAVLIEPSVVQVRYEDIHLENLPTAMEGLTIAQFSDPHIGSGVGERVMERAVKIANEEGVDIAVFTGDFYDSKAYEQPHEYAERFTSLAASINSRYGHYAVLGNHDHWLNADIISQHILEAGITLLNEEATRVDIEGNGLWVLGVDDTGIGVCPGRISAETQFTPHITGLQESMADIPDNEPRFLLAHNPDIVMWLEDTPIDFVLSGHLHGGHIRLPFIGAPINLSCFRDNLDQGWGVDTPISIYINRGLGGMRFRFGAPPELTIFRLTGNPTNGK